MKTALESIKLGRPMCNLHPWHKIQQSIAMQYTCVQRINNVSNAL